MKSFIFIVMSNIHLIFHMIRRHNVTSPHFFPNYPSPFGRGFLPQLSLSLWESLSQLSLSLWERLPPPIIPLPWGEAR